MAYFLAEIGYKEETTNMEYQPTQARKIPELGPYTWTLFTDGALSDSSSGVGLILTSLDRQQYTYALRFGFGASNNKVEYEALLAGLKIEKTMGVTKP